MNDYDKMDIAAIIVCGIVLVLIMPAIFGSAP